MPKFRRRFPRKGPLPFRYVILLTFVFFIFSTATGLWVVNTALKPTLMKYAESETRKIATLVISNAINKKIASGMELDKIIESVPGQEGMSKLNAEIVNRVKAETTSLVQKNLNDIESGNLSEIELITDVEFEKNKKNNSEGIEYSVPLGKTTNNVLLGNIGPQIPIQFSAIGDVSSDVKTQIKDFGINNAYLQVYVHFKVNVQVIIPFATRVTTITEDVPVAMFLLKGNVPQFYNSGGKSSAPSFEVPKQTN
ncbi:sporulation protein YunB [Bacillus sp. 1NLA3E]|uniref:sporulation protein YunB n=1 Tax=Bacillus sp. 1NLA3E TaxID=666686 RepID=UPI000247F381|nr:sporulation protein YunB [Bacillus sp. 1NLA3E]